VGRGRVLFFQHCLEMHTRGDAYERRLHTRGDAYERRCIREEMHTRAPPCSDFMGAPGTVAFGHGPALGKRPHRGLSGRGIALSGRAMFVLFEGQRPHPRASYGCGVCLEDASHNGAARQHVGSSSLQCPDERLADARLRISTSRPASIIAISLCPNPPLPRASPPRQQEARMPNQRGISADHHPVGSRPP
jgi:hypothetical protein